MKDQCLEIAAGQKGQTAKLNMMREYLQAYILRKMHAQGFFRSGAFVGGTALRFLYRLPRFSEDLDFSVTGSRHYVFRDLIKSIKDDLVLSGYQVTVIVKDDKTVESALIKFSGILFEAGLSPMASQIFSIKIEMDTRPPLGAVLKTHLVNVYFPVAFLSYDEPSLLAGKLHAILSRKYTKGRDFFDLGWYLSRWKGLSPNMELLQNALKQSQWSGPMPDAANWRGIIREAVQKADWAAVRDDVKNFLENPNDLEIISRENILTLLAD